MEYVDGKPIDTYCDEHRLTINQRLELFRSVCAAVHSAHQNLIVHRDLKPSNILVDANGQVHLLDFGIAKLLEQDPTVAAQVTQFGNPAFTPDYASPEQMRGQPVTALTDVYSFGVVLYQLLSGSHPFPPGSASSSIVDEIARRTAAAEQGRR
jgi:serine/threonine protein kinase